MSFSFHPAAEAEFNKAIDYYQEVNPALAFDFVVEVYAAIKRSIMFPKAWPILDGDIRRVLVRRFPFGILYSVEIDGIYVIAVMHLHREPGYWKSRT